VWEKKDLMVDVAPETWNNLCLAESSCNSQPRGVETFRDGLSHIAAKSVQNIKRGLIAAP